LELWNDATFKKQFLRGYGALTEVEPTLSDVEREQMKKLSQFMATKPIESLRALQAVTTAESSAEFDFVLGQLSQQTNQPVAKTINHFVAAVKKFPNFRRAHYALGRVLTQTDQYDLAVPYLTKAMELGQADPVLYGLLGYCHLGLKNFASSESAYRMALVMQPKSVDWRMGLIRALLPQDKADECVALCDEMIAADSEKAELWMLQLNAFILKKDFLRAATNFEMIARLGKATAQDFLKLGDIYLNEALPEAAFSAYERAFNHQEPVTLPEAIRVVEGMAARRAFTEAKNLLAGLRSTFGKAAGDAEKRRLMRTEARIALGEGQGGKSAEILEEVVQLDPMDGDALMLLGQHYNSVGEKERAIGWYKRAEQIEAFEADASVRHAQILVSLNKRDEAIPLLKRAQQVKPRDNVAKFLEDLERFQKQRR
jgi:tetratricopeptide (TPR) repeat protein